MIAHGWRLRNRSPSVTFSLLSVLSPHPIGTTKTSKGHALMGRKIAPTPPPSEVDIMDVVSLDMRRPALGDHLNLFKLEEAAVWLRIGAPTLKRMIASGEIPAEYLTRPGVGARMRTKTFMSGDQIMGLLAHWRLQTALAAGRAAAPAPRRRRSPRKAA